MPTELELFARLGTALVLGGAIGLERELAGQVAGLRTHMSVALGAALFGIVSAYGWNEFAAVRAETNVQIDVTRIASNIVTGVGFLGGGAILKEGATVRGLTTAASLWVTAAVGLAVALGGYSLAAVTTIGLVFSLVLLRGPRAGSAGASRCPRSPEKGAPCPPTPAPAFAGPTAPCWWRWRSSAGRSSARRRDPVRVATGAALRSSPAAGPARVATS